MSSVSIRPLDDEWWTTAMVCSYLKLKRRALWDIRRDPAKAFPAAVKRNRPIDPAFWGFGGGGTLIAGMSAGGEHLEIGTAGC